MIKNHLTLSKEDQIYLEQLLRKGSLPVKMYKRVTALLELNRGRTFTAVAEIVGMTQQTVSIWADKYAKSGLTFLTDKPRSGRPPEIDGLVRTQITALATSDAPPGYGQWSLRLLADKAVELDFIQEISHTEVGRILKKTSLNLTSADNGVSVK